MKVLLRAIAEVRVGQQILWVFWIVLELLPELTHVRPEVLRFEDIFGSPDRSQ